MSVINNEKSSVIIVDHWKIKFEKAIKVLLDNGYKIDDLIEKLKSVAQEHYETKHN